MLSGIVIVIILIGLAWVASRWRSKDPKNRDGKVPPAFNYFGWGFTIFILGALIISIFMSIKST